LAELSPYERLRRAIRDLAILAHADLGVLWRSVRSADDAVDALHELLPDLVDTYGSAAAALAADFYDEIREVAQAPKRFTAILPDPGDTGSHELVGWAAQEATDLDAFRTLIEGGMQRRIANASRDVITTSSIADPSARGWMRTGNGGCDFCAMLISRGAVYTEKTVDFASHDWCDCGAAPAFNPSQIRAVRKEFVPSARRRSESVKAADRERVREWIADNL
jgi:hypothetical protein